MALFRGREQHLSQPGKGTAQTQLLPETTWNDEPMPVGVPEEGKVVVTISRQFGSGGSSIGKIVARESGLLYLDSEILNEVAERLGVNIEQVASQDEQTAGTARHILEALHAHTPFHLNYGTLFNPPAGKTPVQSQELAYFRLTQQVVLELATKGDVVIIGRGSQFLLHGAPRTLHIYIFAPLPYRIENVMKHLHLTRTQAVELIERRDGEHENYLRHHYGADGTQPGLYHLLINTGLFSFELAAHLIEQALPVVREIGT